MTRCDNCGWAVHTSIETIEQRDYAPEMVEVAEVLTCGCDDKKAVIRSVRLPKGNIPDGWL